MIKGKQSTQIIKLTSTYDNSQKVGDNKRKSNLNIYKGYKVNDTKAISHAD